MTIKFPETFFGELKDEDKHFQVASLSRAWQRSLKGGGKYYDNTGWMKEFEKKIEGKSDDEIISTLNQYFDDVEQIIRDMHK